ncbi:MAG: thiolase family protein, partial [Pseudomonadota bacterium]
EGGRIFRMQAQNRRAAITGVGMSEIGRKLDIPASVLLAQAARKAMALSGLTIADIDGLTTYPGKSDLAPGMSPLGCVEARDILGLQTRWHSSSYDGPAQFSAIMIAAMAVATGQARHVLCFRALTESSSQSAKHRASLPTGGSTKIGGQFQWLLPMGAPSATNWTAQFATRIMHEYDLTREDLGQQCIFQRANAQKNPHAVFNGKMLSMDEYIGSRMISEPLCLFDCDIPIDGACAVIVSAADAAVDCHSDPIWIEAMGSALTDRDSWDQRTDLTTMAAHDVGKDLWARTDFKPSDVDLAGLYDGFSIYVPMWLEALDFCGRGEGGQFIRAGKTTLEGELPTNTSGGQLSEGRLHGFGLLHEICYQLWGLADARQLAKADCAVCGVGGGPVAGALLLIKE